MSSERSWKRWGLTWAEKTANTTLSLSSDRKNKNLKKLRISNKKLNRPTTKRFYRSMFPWKTWPRVRNQKRTMTEPLAYLRSTRRSETTLCSQCSLISFLCLSLVLFCNRSQKEWSRKRREGWDRGTNQFNNINSFTKANDRIRVLWLMMLWSLKIALTQFNKSVAATSWTQQITLNKKAHLFSTDLVSLSLGTKSELTVVEVMMIW
jgi:hypothetical protein